MRASILVPPGWNSEFMLTNSRIFGNHGDGITLCGGVHGQISNNVIADNGVQPATGAASGIKVCANVSNFVIQGNHIGAAMKGQRKWAGTNYGVLEWWTGHLVPVYSNLTQIIGLRSRWACRSVSQSLGVL